MLANLRAEGDDVRLNEVHVVPSHVQVSVHPPQLPPKRTTFPIGSIAIAIPKRADGDDMGFAWVHVVPSQVHVSPQSGGLVIPFDEPHGVPPNSTTLPVPEWKARPMCARPTGEVVGCISFHADPFQIHVSAHDVAVSLHPSPPKRTSVPVLLS
jgi:hypothetical protein